LPVGHIPDRMMAPRWSSSFSRLRTDAPLARVVRASSAEVIGTSAR
jgi:hypothetical protein